VSGGAVAYLSPLGASPLDPRPWLRLGHVKLHRNHADKDGGAFLVLGNASGDAVMISKNQAGESGGAIAIVGVGILPTEAVPATIAGKLPVSGTQRSTVELTRTFVLDNTATQDAVAATQGIVRFGNTIIARNEATAAGGAAVHGADIELANSTVMGNKSDGVSIEAFGTHGALLANTIVAGNMKNCVGPVVSLTTVGANLQFPGNICGASVATAEPSLDSRFRPSLTSPARSTGTLTICASHDLVAGVDVYGNPRDAVNCSIGAAEADLVNDAVRAVGVDRVPCLLLLILIFLLVCLFIGFIIGVRRRRKKKTAPI
jgi:predicted outer membrane repeat protein